MLTFKEWFEEYNRQYGLPPADVVAKAAWEYAYICGINNLSPNKVEDDRDSQQQG